MNPRNRSLIAVALWLVALGSLRAQGGPPMITDDPGTPGDGKWEINLAIAFEHRPGETAIDAPGIDLNYGVGDRIQLTLQGGLVLLKRSDHGAIGGLGGTEAALKWRFIDDQQMGITMSMFPRIVFNISQSAVRRGLAEDGTRFQIPLQFAKAFPGFDLDFEGGPLVSTVGPAQWLYGVVVAVDVSKTAAVMAELHGSARTNFSDDELAGERRLSPEIGRPLCVHRVVRPRAAFARSASPYRLRGNPAALLTMVGTARCAVRAGKTPGGRRSAAVPTRLMRL